ncbi:MAG: UDP-N-acetylmuramoyl-L-alanyl-D-glutamate--2,6-diaminopimelate ligase [Clostridia bacterium]|nr:UDP-N-acetylmuramoyl-L-alanyl-D-glutamate--2,6-diaminopimelate ligase [Clostridia bacterium]
MKLEQLLTRLNYTIVSGNTDIEISDVIYDSRKACKDCVFVCLKGANLDSHKFAQSAVDSGAVAVVVSEDIEINNATVIKVNDTRKALAFMSAEYFGNPAEELTTIGITGTKGKTTTASMIHSILEKGGYKTGIIGTLGIIIGDELIKTSNTTPESYEIQQAMRKMIDKGCKCVVMEASSLGLKWHRTDGFIFDYGVFTNFSHDHIGGDEHASMEEYLECKSMLFRQCTTGIINIDDENAENIIKNHTCSIETYGFSEKAQLRASDDELISKPGYLGVRFNVSGKLNMTADVDIPGKFTVYNALSAIAVCMHFNLTKEQIFDGLNEVKVKGRVEPVKIPGNFTLLIDYAHNAVSMENILETLREYKPKRLVTLFGAGGNRPRDRRYEMGEISGKLSDLSVITEDNSRFENVMDIIEDIKVGINKTNGKYVVIPDRTDAIRYCIENAQDGDIIVLAGKGHEDYQDKNGKKTHYDEREVIADIIGK